MSELWGKVKTRIKSSHFGHRVLYALDERKREEKTLCVCVCARASVTWSLCGVPQDEHAESTLDWLVRAGKDLVFKQYSGYSVKNLS